jgi:hypothetical protein
MIVLVIGVKGGVGTTRVALELAQGAPRDFGRRTGAVSVDLADGQFAAQRGQTTWALMNLAFGNGVQIQSALEMIVRQSLTLLWSIDCNLVTGPLQNNLRAVGNRSPVVMDGGLEVPGGLEVVADEILIVSAENEVARWHERRLCQRYPHARVIEGTREAARSVAAQLFVR